MKVIDLLNKIANNEEVPQYVEYRNWNNNNFEKMLVCKENLFYKLDQLEIYLNDEIEIIEEKPKKIEEIDICPLDTTYQGLSSLDRATRSNVNKLLEKVDELTKAVNYLLEKESDK